MPDSSKSIQRDRRTARLREALRKNLKRRKAQARARLTALSDAKEEGSPHDSVEIVPEKAED